MPTLNVITREGQQRSVEGTTGHTVKDILLDNGFDEILALCGGSCSCATCHVHVAEDYVAATGRMSEDENDLLDSVPDRDAGSRLSCQVLFGPELDGMTVTIGEEG